MCSHAHFCGSGGLGDTLDKLYTKTPQALLGRYFTIILLLGFTIFPNLELQTDGLMPHPAHPTAVCSGAVLTKQQAAWRGIPHLEQRTNGQSKVNLPLKKAQFHYQDTWRTLSLK